MLTRRSLLVGIGSALAAPAIVKYANIMPVRNRLLTLAEWQVQMLIRTLEANAVPPVSIDGTYYYVGYIGGYLNSRLYEYQPKQ